MEAPDSEQAGPSPGPPSDDQCRWQLKPLQVGDLDGNIEVTPEGVTLGRSESNTVVIPEAGFPYVSSSHCRIMLLEDVPIVEDLGSKNGTLVNGEAVERGAMANGDILQLGSMGPRFAVVCTDNLRETLPTVAIPPSAARKTRRGHDLTQSALLKIKRALGVPRDADVGSLIEKGASRKARSVWVGLGVVAIGAVATLVVIEQNSAAEADRLRELNKQLRDDLMSMQTSTETALREQREARLREKLTLEGESARLLARLKTLEGKAGASAGDLDKLRERLASTNKTLELYNPVDVEKRRLRGVARVTGAVVFIETRTYLRDVSSQKLLHSAERSDGSPDLNTDDRGKPFYFESSGSGFVVTKEGWVITNAHVVEPDRDSGLPAQFEQVNKLFVVFSKTSKRHPAKKIKSVFQGTDDLALLKISPFEGMGFIEKIQLDLPVPELNETLYLSGFPLGKLAVQESGGVVVASTFKGIMSRVVHPYIQVDAAVHRGNSGGPVIDAQGRVIGVVTRVQTDPHGTVPTIGYILPVATLHKVWPPPDAGAAAKGGKKKK